MTRWGGKDEANKGRRKWRKNLAGKVRRIKDKRKAPESEGATSTEA